MKRVVSGIKSGVKISFGEGVEKEKIVKMVQNCANGECECMSDETKRRIEKMEVKGEDGDIELELTGNISEEEIEAALSRSKLLND